MNILVIKQTSLGDVLHSTGIVRSVKQAHPDANIILLTAAPSLPIYQHNPWVDEIIVFDRNAIKYGWYKNPVWCLRHIIDILKRIRRYQFTLAFDLQGLFKSVIFLYGARSKAKYVKGTWLGLNCFDDRSLHAITEMQRVVELANIKVHDASMEIHGSQQDRMFAEQFVQAHNQQRRPVVIISPFTRVAKKDWPLGRFMQLVSVLSANYFCVLTGAPDKQQAIVEALVQNNLNSHPNIINAAGRFSLLQFAELVDLAALVISADSFAVHLSGAKKTPVIALFGPTDETKVGPLGDSDIVLRARHSTYSADSVKDISVQQVVQSVQEVLSTNK